MAWYTPAMPRRFSLALLVCFLFSLIPAAQAVDTPRSRARAQRQARAFRKFKKNNRQARARYGRPKSARKHNRG